jgi:hypothetical protein
MGGMALFGVDTWMQRAECFSIFFRMVGALAPVQWPGGGGERMIRIGVPGHALRGLDLSPPGAVAFVLVALSTVSFDGFMRTFAWLGLNGVNPLEFPGRSAMMAVNSLGLAGAAIGFLLVYAVVIAIGRWPVMSFGARLAPFAVSIVPIAFGYHLAHYLPALPLETLKALKALSDPFATGANLLGLAALEPPASLTAGHAAATFVYRLQTAIIVVAHVVAVVTAHGIAMRLVGHDAPRRALLRLELPLTLLMIGYTVLGLWLLSTPVIG